MGIVASEDLRLWTEMKQEPCGKTRCSQVVVQLPMRRLVKLLSGLDFDDQNVVHNHVQTLSSQLEPLVEDRDQARA
jgi:hypothetical protein